ncbi:MAG TPA: SpoIID/LytB domain-containing protein [Firmicutes bacterium]|nr:SpoIID/LytB domain-containing protein [Bacillota bacterium]
MFKSLLNLKKPVSIFIIIFSLLLPAFASDIRVLLSHSTATQKITSNKGMIIYDLSGKKGVKVIPFREAAVSYSRRKIEVFVNGKTYREDGLILKPEKGGQLHFNKKYYRGTLMIIPSVTPDKYYLINVIDLEEYLLGVVAEEIPHAWHIEALKAQAIAARTYAYEKMINNKPNAKYDVLATDMSQVYGGVNSERESTTNAVKETKGIIMTYRGKPIAAFFHSTCGGGTDDAAYVWGSNFPYLRKVSCTYCKPSPHYEWNYIIDIDKLEDILDKNGYDIGYIKKISLVGKSDAGRIKDIEIAGSKKTVRISSNNFRIMVGAKNLKSTRFSATLKSRKLYLSGNGFGHGIGMCQWGAKGMAEHGYKYNEILRHYYKNINLKKI